MDEDQPILSVRDLDVEFRTSLGVTRAVRGASFDLKPGKTLALVGESGSGKSVTSFAILRLIQPPGQITRGQINFASRDGLIDLASLKESDKRLYAVRGGQIGMIFQEPMTALSPVHTIGEQVAEVVRIHERASHKTAWESATQMMARVGIPEPARRMKQYPFEFSGGMRQRVVIAMALVCRPRLLIADEPTTALDVTVQAQILSLINDLKRETGAAVLFITHDLGVVAQVADDVAVMNGGRILETAPVRDVYRRPMHPYTRKLLRAMPRIDRPEVPDVPLPPLPDGYGVEESTSGMPRFLEVEPGRHLLVWPNGQQVEAA